MTLISESSSNPALSRISFDYKIVILFFKMLFSSIKISDLAIVVDILSSISYISLILDSETKSWSFNLAS